MTDAEFKRALKMSEDAADANLRECVRMVPQHQICRVFFVALDDLKSKTGATRR